MLSNIYVLLYNRDMNKSFIYLLNGQEYTVNITYKRIRNIHYRYKDGAFAISCHRLTPMSLIKSGLDKFAPKLIKRNAKEQGEGEDYIYLFGEKYPLSFPGTVTILDETISFENKEQLHKKLKKLFLNYVTNQTIKWAEEMNAPIYQVKVREMRSRYGTNNRAKKTITYAMSLLYYSPEIINSVVIHELTHCFVYDHSDKFYRLLYKYCPNYDIFRKKLIKAVFQ